MSNGAIMNYELATGPGHASLAARIASMAPAAGAPLMGFNFPPHTAISLMDIRGALDNTVPANVSNGWPAPWFPGQVEPGPHNSSLSGDGFFYTPIDNITAAWRGVLGCDNALAHYPTRFDGIEGFHCVSPHGACGGAGKPDLVRCYHTGGHTWPWRLRMLNGDNFFAELVFEFFAAHPRP
jgi:poly(3-hydroxybutyrate) depolymerase